MPVASGDEVLHFVQDDSNAQSTSARSFVDERKLSLRRRRLRGEPPADGLHIGLCSCRSCRKAHARALQCLRVVPRGNFRWLHGEDKTRIYESSPGKNRHFCSVCGSQLIAEHPGESNVLLRVALLDDDPGARPVEHIFRSQQVPWCDWEARHRAL